MRILNKKLKEVWDADPVDTFQVYQHAIESFEKLNRRFESSVKELAAYVEAASDAFIMMSIDFLGSRGIPFQKEDINKMGVSRAITEYISGRNLKYTVKIHIPSYILLDWMEFNYLKKFTPIDLPILAALVDIARKNALEPDRISQGSDRFFKSYVENKSEADVSTFTGDRRDHLRKDITVIEVYFARGPLTVHRTANGLGIKFVPEQGEKFMVNPDADFFRSYDLESLVSHRRSFTNFIGFLKNEVSEEDSEQLQKYKGAR